MPSENMSREALERLEEWFENNCDGDREHGAGIRIETLDNPGWMNPIRSYGNRNARYKNRADIKSRTG